MPICAVTAGAAGGADLGCQALCLDSAERQHALRVLASSAGHAEPLATGSAVAVLGFGGGAPLKSDSGGVVWDPRPETLDYFTFSADVLHGASGAAIFDGERRIVGLAARGAGSELSDRDKQIHIDHVAHIIATSRQPTSPAKLIVRSGIKEVVDAITARFGKGVAFYDDPARPDIAHHTTMSHFEGTDTGLQESMEPVHASPPQ